LSQPLRITSQTQVNRNPLRSNKKVKDIIHYL
jgi:hypothetical protein